MNKKLIAVLTLAVMVVTSIPSFAFATTKVEDGTTIALTLAETEGIGVNGGETSQGADATGEQKDVTKDAGVNSGTSESGTDKGDAAGTSKTDTNTEDTDGSGTTDGSDNQGTTDGIGDQDKDGQDTDSDTGADDQDKDADIDEDDEDEEGISDYQKGLAAYIRSKNGNLSRKWSEKLAGYFIKYGNKYGVDEKVVMALALRESRFRAKATSHAGHKGMLQINDRLARSYGYKPSSLYKAYVSIKIGTIYIQKMKKKYGSYSKAICCFVCGSGAVASGNYSREPGQSVMKTQKAIKKFLKNNGYPTSG